MKNIKRMLLAIVSIVGFASLCSSLNATQDPKFEIYNKGPYDIYYYLPNFKEKKTTIKPGKTLNSSSIPKEFLIQDSKAGVPYQVKITKDMTAERKAFFTYDPSKINQGRVYIYPQTGTQWGISGKSNSGYSLSNNIEISEFTVGFDKNLFRN